MYLFLEKQKIINLIEFVIEFGFYLFIFLLPWQTRLIWHEAFLNGQPFEYGRFSLYGTEILLWVVVLSYGFWLCLNRPTKKIDWARLGQLFKQPATLTYFLVFIFLIISLISLVWSLDLQLAYFRWFVLVEAVVLFSLVVVFNLPLRKIAWALVASALVQSVLAIWEFFVQWVPANKWLGLAEHLPTVSGSIILQTETERWLRAYGSLPHPNLLGGFLVLALLFTFWLGLTTTKRFGRIFVLASLITIVPALFFTFSRSAWLALIFSLIIMSFGIWLQKDKELKTKFFRLLFLFGLLVTVLSATFSQALATRINPDQYSELNSLRLRLTYTKQAWQLITENPVLGQGIGNYTLAVYQKIDQSWPNYFYQPVHNLYLLVFAELGIFGILIFILILVLLLWHLSRLVLASWQINLDLERLILLLSFVSILIISLFDHYFWTLYFGVVVFWLILGLNLKLLKK